MHKHTHDAFPVGAESELDDGETMNIGITT